MPPPYLILTPSKDAPGCRTGSYRESSLQDATQVFLCYKNTYAREDYRKYSGSIPGRNQKFGEGILSLGEGTGTTHLWLNLPPPTKLGIPRARVATALNLHSPAVTGLPSTQPSSTNKCENISLSKKNCECHWRSGKTPVWL